MSRRPIHVQIPVKNSREGVMVWCGMSLRGLIGPNFFDNSVTGQTYLAMLSTFVWPRIRQRRMIFQQPILLSPVGAIMLIYYPDKFEVGLVGPQDSVYQIVMY
jgi:hypothetical protein